MDIDIAEPRGIWSNRIFALEPNTRVVRSGAVRALTLADFFILAKSDKRRSHEHASTELVCVYVYICGNELRVLGFVELEFFLF